MGIQRFDAETCVYFVDTKEREGKVYYGTFVDYLVPNAKIKRRRRDVIIKTDGYTDEGQVFNIEPKTMTVSNKDCFRTLSEAQLYRDTVNQEITAERAQAYAKYRGQVDAFKEEIPDVKALCEFVIKYFYNEALGYDCMDHPYVVVDAQAKDAFVEKAKELLGVDLSNYPISDLACEKEYEL